MTTHHIQLMCSTTVLKTSTVLRLDLRYGQYLSPAALVCQLYQFLPERQIYRVFGGFLGCFLQDPDTLAYEFLKFFLCIVLEVLAHQDRLIYPVLGAVYHLAAAVAQG